jgi:hypothetical protein
MAAILSSRLGVVDAFLQSLFPVTENTVGSRILEPIDNNAPSGLPSQSDFLKIPPIFLIFLRIVPEKFSLRTALSANISTEHV